MRAQCPSGAQTALLARGGGMSALPCLECALGSTCAKRPARWARNAGQPGQSCVWRGFDRGFLSHGTGWPRSLHTPWTNTPRTDCMLLTFVQARGSPGAQARQGMARTACPAERALTRSVLCCWPQDAAAWTTRSAASRSGPLSRKWHPAAARGRKSRVHTLSAHLLQHPLRLGLEYDLLRSKGTYIHLIYAAQLQ